MKSASSSGLQSRRGPYPPKVHRWQTALGRYDGYLTIAETFSQYTVRQSIPRLRWESLRPLEARPLSRAKERSLEHPQVPLSTPLDIVDTHLPHPHFLRHCRQRRALLVLEFLFHKGSQAFLPSRDPLPVLRLRTLPNSPLLPLLLPQSPR